MNRRIVPKVHRIKEGTDWEEIGMTGLLTTACIIAFALGVALVAMLMELTAK